MKKSKKKNKLKKIHKPKLPANESFWLSVSQNPDQILAFLERGDETQKKNLKDVINFRLWQIQEGRLDKDYFGDLDVSKLDFNMKPVKLIKGSVGSKIIPKIKKPIDLFDMGNIEDLIT